MRGRWLLAPLIVASGCLYLGRINHAPTVDLEVGEHTANKGMQFDFVAHATDDEDDATTLKVTFTVYDENGVAQRCDYFAPDNNGAPAYSVTFYRAGVFTVAATAQDHLGTVSEAAKVQVVVTDAPPTFENGGTLGQTIAKSVCDANPSGTAVPLALQDSVVDPDAVTGGCGGPTPPLSLTWRITSSPAGAHAVLTPYIFSFGHCAAPTSDSTTSITVGPSTQVCLFTDGAVMTPMASYTVVVEASDGNSVVTSKELTVPVVPNQPPCITGEYPSVGSYVVDRTQPQTLTVTSAIDDRDVIGAGLTFQWSLSSTSNPEWVTVPSASPVYTLDASSYGVGEIVHVRVEAFDSATPPVSGATVCAATQPDCNMQSCVLQTQGQTLCHKWRTWDLELR